MEEKSHPNITTVNDDDEVIGYMQLPEALALGLRRRISAVFIFNHSGNILIQRRAALVLSPNLLDFSAAGHVNEGDTYIESAKNELVEELGVVATDLRPVAAPLKILDMYVSVFKSVVPDDVSITLNQEEVATTRFVSYEELAEMVLRHPSQFAKPFLAVWPHVYDKILL